MADNPPTDERDYAQLEKRASKYLDRMCQIVKKEIHAKVRNDFTRKNRKITRRQSNSIEGMMSMMQDAYAGYYGVVRNSWLMIER